MKKNQGRKKALSILVSGFLFLSAGIAGANDSNSAAVTAEEALQKLMDGNKNYVDEKPTLFQRSTAKARAALAASQKPYAVVLTCSDSRVPPEIIFDKGLGELFVIRVAGNIPDPVVLGSIEYAVEHLGTPLVVVLGHERCGAVTAAVTANGKSTGSPHIDAIAKTIEPNIEAAAHDCAICKGEANCLETKKKEFVECVTDHNAKSVAANLTKESALLRHLVEEKKVRITAAKYDLDDGKVTLY